MKVYVLYDKEIEENRVFDDYESLCQYVLENNMYYTVYLYDKVDFYNYYLYEDDMLSEIPEIIDSWNVWKHPTLNSIMEG